MMIGCEARAAKGILRRHGPRIRSSSTICDRDTLPNVPGDLMTRSTNRRWQLILATSAGLLLVASIVLLSRGCNTQDGTGKTDPAITSAGGRKDVVKLPGVRFVDVTAKAGIRFRHTNGGF